LSSGKSDNDLNQGVQMKILILIALFSFSSISMARSCKTNANGEIDAKNRCELTGHSYLRKQCKEVKVPGSVEGTFKYTSQTKKIGWISTTVADDECDVTIFECKALAEKLLAKFSQTDECEQEISLKNVKFEYQVLDGLDLEFKTIHKGKIRN
jgi:hypothetical protein